MDHNIWQHIILYMLAFTGAWHLIGIPPIKDWFSKDKGEKEEGPMYDACKE
jgi:hypothetical protein